MRRWAETLDRYSFLRFGADHAEDLRFRSGHGHHAEFHKRDELRDVPGLVGDSRVGEKVGHVTLVNRPNFARKDKLYN